AVINFYEKKYEHINQKEWESDDEDEVQRPKTKIEIRQERRKQKLLQRLHKHLNHRRSQYLGPIEEDSWWRLLLFQSFRSSREGKEHRQDELNLRAELVSLVVEQEEHDPRRAWLKLFTDLIFVAVVVKFGSVVSDNYMINTAHGDLNGIFSTLLENVVFFVPFFMLWLELNITLIRFGDIRGKMAGIIDDCLLFLFLFALTCSSTQIMPQEKLFTSRHSTNFVFTKITYLFFFELKKSYCKRRLWTYATAVAIFCFGIWFPLRAVTILSGSAVILYTSVVSFRIHPKAFDSDVSVAKTYQNPVIDFCTARFGIGIMIILGQSVIAIMIVVTEVHAKQYFTVFFGFAIVYILKLMYFDSDAKDEGHG
ncbi:low temperature requirement protein A, partial [Reticulomyxa filosa]